MDKKRVLQEIVSHLALEARDRLAAAKETRGEAIHEDSRAEHKYDTRGLEASYLAEAQARQAEDARHQLALFETLRLREYGPADPIGLGALIEVRLGNHRDRYFTGPASGGLEVEIDGVEVTVVTCESPLGKHLFGARQGARFELNGREGRIEEVS